MDVESTWSRARRPRRRLLHPYSINLLGVVEVGADDERDDGASELTTFTSHSRSQRGQSLVIVLLFMTVLIGMAAAVIDVGSWYRTDRKLQANADAAALAGAGALRARRPPSRRRLGRQERRRRREEERQVSLDRRPERHDRGTRAAGTGLLRQALRLRLRQVRAKAAARAGVMNRARWAAPVAIDWRHEKLQCECWGDRPRSTSRRCRAPSA